MSRRITGTVAVGLVLLVSGAGAAWSAFQAGAPLVLNGHEIVPIVGDQGIVAGVARSSVGLPAAQRAAIVADRLNSLAAELGTAFVVGPCGATDIWVNTANGPRRILTVFPAEARAVGAHTTAIAAHWANTLRWVYGNVAPPAGFAFNGDTTWRTIPDKVEAPPVPEGVQVRDLAPAMGCGGWGSGYGCWQGCGCGAGCWQGRGYGGGAVPQWDGACGEWVSPGPCGYWRNPCAQRWNPCMTPCPPRGVWVGDGEVALWRSRPCP